MYADRTQPPPWLVAAEHAIGVREIAGAEHNDDIVSYFAEAGFSGIKDDETAWCAAFANAMVKRGGREGTGSLLARSFLKWGVELKTPRLGCIAVFKRGNSTWQGHVGFYVGETATHIRVLGGNQSNAVNVRSYPKSKLLGYRWPEEPEAVELPAPIPAPPETRVPEMNNLIVMLIEKFIPNGYKTVAGLLLYLAVDVSEKVAPEFLSDSTVAILYAVATALGGVGILHKAEKIGDKVASAKSSKATGWDDFVSK